MPGLPPPELELPPPPGGAPEPPVLLPQKNLRHRIRRARCRDLQATNRSKFSAVDGIGAIAIGAPSEAEARLSGVTVGSPLISYFL